MITPSFRLTVTPGKFPTCWFDPVSWLNRVVLPLFWFPTSAKVSRVPSGRGLPLPLGWKRPPSPSPGWTVFCRESSGGSSRAGTSFLFVTGSTMTCSASARRMVSSYPCIISSMGSPMGAYFFIVTSVPGITPISRKCWRNAPSPPTAVITAVRPISRSFNVML